MGEGGRERERLSDREREGERDWGRDTERDGLSNGPEEDQATAE